MVMVIRGPFARDIGGPSARSGAALGCVNEVDMIAKCERKGGCIANSSIRWRAVILQAVMILVLAGAATIAYSAGTFSHNQIKDQLTAQIFFRLRARSWPAELSTQLSSVTYPVRGPAGHRRQSGSGLREWFIGLAMCREDRHGGAAYAEGGTRAQAKPTDTKLAEPGVQTLFRGETFAACSSTPYSWWTIGTHALFAASGIAIAALAVLRLSFSSAGQAVRDRKVTVRTRPAAVPASA